MLKTFLYWQLGLKLEYHTIINSERCNDHIEKIAEKFKQPQKVSNATNRSAEEYCFYVNL